jgi:hypothetical protein
VDTKQILTFLPAKTSETKPIRVFFMCPPPHRGEHQKNSAGGVTRMHTINTT